MKERRKLAKKRRRKNENPVARWLKDVIILIIDNKVIASAILGFIVLAVIAVVFISAISKKRQAIDANTVVVETEDPNQVVIPEEPLEVDAYEGVNALMRKYYDAAAAGDVEAVKAIKTSVDEKEEIILQTKANYIDSYPVVTVYTKKGPVDNSFIVFAYYEVKLTGYESTAPGLNAWYVCQKEDGSYYINDDEQDDKLKEYCQIVSVQDDVVDLNNTVNVKFNEAVEADPDLASFLELLPDILTASVGEELARVDEQESTESVDTTQGAGDSDTTETPGATKKAKTTDVVKIRVSDSMTADTVGKAQKGQEFTVLEVKVNGWTKVEYEGKECYIKSEYLIIEGEETVADNDGDTGTTAGSNDVDEAAAGESPSSGKAKAKCSINLRKSADANSEKICTIPGGEEVTVVEKQSNGWSKIKYNGDTGFVKSENLEKK